MSVDDFGFDKAYYRARNPDVVAAGLDLFQHYLQFGWREGRNPNPLFDVKFYLATYLDVAAAQIDPLTHYLQSGQRELRDTGVAFSPRDYLFNNPDVKAAGIEALEHYLEYGWRERRKLSFSEADSLDEGFDRDFYRATYSDIAAAGIDPYVHYQAWGNREGRAPNALFDKAWYLARNPDVAAAGVDALTHFLDYGWREGRDPSANFNLALYRDATDLNNFRNPLLDYLVSNRWQGLPFGEAPPQIVQARGSGARFIFVAPTELAIGDPLTRVTSRGSPIDGRDLFGYNSYLLEQSSGDISFSGSGRFPNRVQLGPGNDSITGSFTLSGMTGSIYAGGGTLTVNATFNDGSLFLVTDGPGSNVMIGGTVAVSFSGSNGPDSVRTTSGDDTFTLGSGTNFVDGGLGSDRIYWTQAVIVDLVTGRASSRTPGLFDDTFFNIEGIDGSPFDDVLLGDNANNRIFGNWLLPQTSGNDILVGRGGDDNLWGGVDSDVLIGGSGVDILVGSAGNDILIDGADGRSIFQNFPTANGGPGDDVFVHFLGPTGDEARGSSLALGGSGADLFIIDTSRGRWTFLEIEFSQIDGDKIDLSMLRTVDGRVLTLTDVIAAVRFPLSPSILIELSRFEDVSGNALSGFLILEGGSISSSDLKPADFIFSDATPWRSLLPPAVLPEYLI